MGLEIDAVAARLHLCGHAVHIKRFYAETYFIRIAAAGFCRVNVRGLLRAHSALSLVVRTLKREVRAFGECLGM